MLIWATDVEETVKYPTSNKKPAKDWDRLEAEVKKEVCLYTNNYCFRSDPPDVTLLDVYWFCGSKYLFRESSKACCCPSTHGSNPSVGRLSV